MVQLSKHRVLIINDDGIHATGILLLEKIVRQFTENVVVPDEEKSSASHSISMNIPVRVREIDSRHFAVQITPTDCARFSQSTRS
jgi:5'-nucleotidase